MPKRNFDPTTVTSTIQIFSKGSYEFSVGEPTVFVRTKKDGGLSEGIRYPLVCEVVHDGDPNMKGERQFLAIYPTSEGGLAYGKGTFLMPTLGYNRDADSEKKFNAAYEGQDWGIDFEAKAAGDMWKQPVGKRVIGDLEPGINSEDGSAVQKFNGFRKVA